MSENIDLFEEAKSTTPKKPNKHHPYKTGRQKRSAERKERKKKREEMGLDSEDEWIMDLPSDDEPAPEPEPEPEPKKTKAKKEKKAISPERKKQMLESLAKGRANAKAKREAKKLAKEQPVKEQPPKEEPKTNELEILKNELNEFKTQYKTDVEERKARKLLKQQKKDDEIEQIKIEHQRVKQIEVLAKPPINPVIQPRYSTNSRNRTPRLNLVL